MKTMKRILGLDLGTTSIGWALVNEAQSEEEKSSIIRTGVRVIPLSSDEENDFQKGKAISINADRTLKRGARRNLQRFKLRRDELIKVLKEKNIISDQTILTENGKNTTHTSWLKRSKAASEKISLEDFGKVLLAINKKRGYKSNRKAKDEGDGDAIDGMETAIKLYENDLTPGSLSYEYSQDGKKHLPDFYISDLRNEFQRIWAFQKQYYPEILTSQLNDELAGKSKDASWKICEIPFGLVGIKLEGNKKEQKLEKFRLRTIGLTEKLELEHLAIVFQEINKQMSNSSGYLGAISDRSKSLYFDKQTIGEFLFKKLNKDRHYRLKNQVFYRQDYLDEFEKIWETQSKFYPILTQDLKKEIRDVVIFYQRRLKSQKGLISVCELEGKEIVLTKKDGTKLKKFIGPKVCPKSSPLFQEFKIWQILNNLKLEDLKTGANVSIQEFDQDLSIRQRMFEELNIRGGTKINSLLKLTIKNPKSYTISNYKDAIEGNNTNEALFKAYQTVLELSGHEMDLSKYDSDQIIEVLKEVFKAIGIDDKILEFNAELTGKEYEKQASFRLWHLLYSYEGDNSKSGNERLKLKLQERFGIPNEYAKPFLSLAFKDDYGSLSTKAMQKIMTYLKAGHEYSEASSMAKFNHSHSKTKEEIANRKLSEYLDLLPKNSLRNPVVEKILNQMINVVNAIISEYGQLDEIRVELARELKKSSKERAEMTKNINASNNLHVKFKSELNQIYPFNTGVRITRNDIVKYKLYKELETTGYKTLYTGKFIPLEKLFSKEIDIEHIIPKAKLFDDSFSNKTLSYRQVNLDKGDETANDFIKRKYGEESDSYSQYVLKVENLQKTNKISRAKYLKLMMENKDIPDGFIERDLRNSQYIAKKAVSVLLNVTRTVVPTTGSITSKLREDWQLINVLQELNWNKYDKLGLTYYEKNKDGKKIPKIKDWSKRNDHRHHAMDALTVAFTRHNHIQYFNYQNARRNEDHKQHNIIHAIEQKETFSNDSNKRIIKPPIPIEEFRIEAKKHLQNTLISFKAKNKVVTLNKNKIKIKGRELIKTELTPRGQLHKETVYGKSAHFVTKLEKVGPKFDEEKINLVAKKSHKEALLNRLRAFDNDPKKAFGGKNALSKKPIYVDDHQSMEVPEKVKLVALEDRFTIRKEITPDLKISKVIDAGIRKILENRLEKFEGNAKEAFSNLEADPIWLNEEKGIQIKRVTIDGVANATPLHNKKDHMGTDILDDNSNVIPVDYISTGNNHHVAIYKDEKGELQEKVVSFYEAVILKNQGLAVIDKHFNEDMGWKFLFTMKQNEMFVFPNKELDFDPNEIDLINQDNYHLISPNLFRVQKIASKNYFFRHQFETDVNNIEELKNVAYLSQIGLKKIQNIVKIRINHLGKIVSKGEY